MYHQLLEEKEKDIDQAKVMAAHKFSRSLNRAHDDMTSQFPYQRCWLTDSVHGFMLDEQSGISAFNEFWDDILVTGYAWNGEQ